MKVERLPGEVLSIENISITPQGGIRKLTRGRIRRWIQAKRGWQHIVGHQVFPGPTSEPRS